MKYKKFSSVCLKAVESFKNIIDLCHEEAFESGLNFRFATSPAIGPDMAREMVTQV